MVGLSKKGISLPVEMIVIIAIAVLVLVVVAALFSGGIIGPGGTICYQNAFNQGCDILKTRGCQTPLSNIVITKSDCDSNKVDDTLNDVYNYYKNSKYPTDVDFRKGCGCP